MGCGGVTFSRVRSRERTGRSLPFALTNCAATVAAIGRDRARDARSLVESDVMRTATSGNSCANRRHSASIAAWSGDPSDSDRWLASCNVNPTDACVSEPSPHVKSDGARPNTLARRTASIAQWPAGRRGDAICREGWASLNDTQQTSTTVARPVTRPASTRFRTGPL